MVAVTNLEVAMPLPTLVCFALGSALLATPALADCEAFRHLEGKAWVDGDCMETPLGVRWWPNTLWGADDQAGSTNWYTKPEVVQRALAQVKQGRALKIGQVYSSDMPLFGDRGFLLRIPGAPTGGAMGKNGMVWNDEFLATEISQVGTQFDGLGHIGVQIGSDGGKAEIRYYNGHSAQEIVTAYGLEKLGSERLHPIVARGVLIDVAAARGVSSMEAGEVISLKDVRAALGKQGMADFALQPGDAVLFRTGWEEHWIRDNAKYNSGSPGIGMEVARWLAEARVGVTGADTWPVDAVPDPDPDCVFCVHTFLQTRHGIVNQENLKLSELAGQGVYQFAYFYSPVPIQGATGSIGAPVAVW
ncbi:MAG: cyclase [Deltaproteobacteria bacterium]|jgi:kynurenine formamidase|nr:cyclase [Deltaproteobacteria bacterium]